MEGGPPPSAGDMKMPANSGLRSARPRTIPVPVPRGRLPGGPSAAAMGTGPSNGLVGMNAARAPPPRANGQFGFQLNPTLGLSTSRAPPSSAPGSVGGRSPPSTSAGSPPSAASPVQTSGSGLAAKIKVKDEPETITRSNSFRILSSGPMANNALSVMRFPSLEDSTRTDLLNWTPPIKMHRFIPEAIAPDPDDVPAVPRWMQRRNEMGELGGPVPSAVGKAPAEEFDISKVDKKTARRKAKQMTRKLKPWRGPKMLLDEEVNGGAAAAAEAERRIKARAEASMSRLPYLLSDSSLNQEHEFEGKLEQGLAGDQYVLLTKTKDGFVMYPVKNFYNFHPKPNVEPLTAEEAELRMKRRIKAEAQHDAAFLRRAKTEVKDEPDSYKAIQSVLSTAGVKIKSEAELELAARRLGRTTGGIGPRKQVRRADDEAEEEDWDFERDASDDEGSDYGGAAWDDEGTRNEGRERAKEEARRYRVTKVMAETLGKDVDDVIEEEYNYGDAQPKRKKKQKVSKTTRRMKSAIEGKKSKKRGADADDLEGDDERDPYVDSDFAADSSSSSESEEEQVILSKAEEALLRRRELDSKGKQKEGTEPSATTNAILAGLANAGKPETPKPKAILKLALNQAAKTKAVGAGSDSELSDAGSAGSGRHKRKREDQLMSPEGPGASATTIVPPPAAAAAGASEPPRVGTPAATTANSTPNKIIKLKLGGPGTSTASVIAPPPAPPNLGGEPVPGANKTRVRQMSDGEMSDGGGGPRKKARKDAGSDVERGGSAVLTQRDFINALLPFSRQGRRVPTRDLINLFKEFIKQDKEGNMKRLTGYIKSLGHSDGGGIMLKDEYLK